MTENVVDIFTKKPVDRRKKRSNQARTVLNRMLSHSDDIELRSVLIVAIDKTGEHVVDYLVEADDFSKSCVILGILSDEMSDLCLGISDLE